LLRQRRFELVTAILGENDIPAIHVVASMTGATNDNSLHPSVLEIHPGRGAARLEGP
jgi:hypothetical protein